MSGSTESMAVSPSSFYYYSYLPSDYFCLTASICVLIFWAGYWVVHMIAISYGKLKLHKKWSIDAESWAVLPGVSILKPLVGVDPNLYSNLESFFTLNYPQYELLFCVHNDSDPALMVVESIRAKYPNVNTRCFIGGEAVGINPKINNMLPGYSAAKFDLVMISDSKMRMKPDTLTDMVLALKDDVGIVTQMPFTCDRQGFAATLEKVFFGTSQARIYLSADAAGVVCSTGMSSLLRRNVLEEAGGMKAFSHYIAEDYFFAQAIVSRGYRCAISSQPAWQNCGICRISDHHDRLVRWAKLRIAMLPQVILLEPLQECMLLGVLSSWAVNVLFQWNSLVFFLVHVTGWMLTDYVLLSIIQNGPLPFGKFEYVVIWLFRELSSLPLFLQALFNPTIVWRTGAYRLKWGGVARQIFPNTTLSKGKLNDTQSSLLAKTLTVIPPKNAEKRALHSICLEQQQQQQHQHQQQHDQYVEVASLCMPAATLDATANYVNIVRTKSEFLRV